MSSYRIYDLARKLNVPSRDLLDLLKKQGIDAKSHMSTVDDATANAILERFEKKSKNEGPKHDEKSFQEKKTGSRTYIPPRKRQRRKPDRSRISERFQQQGERQRIEGEPERQRREVFVEDQKAPGSFKRGDPSAPEGISSQREHGKGPESSRRKDGGLSQAPRATKARPPQHRYDEKRSEKTHPRGRTGPDSPGSSDGRVTSEAAKRKEGQQRQRRGYGQEKKREQYPSNNHEDEQRIDKAPTKRHGKGERFTGKRKDVPVKKKETPVRKKEDKFHDEEPVLKAPVKKKKVKAPAPQPPVRPPVPEPEEPKGPKRLEIPEVIMVKDLAEMMDVPPAKIIRHLMTMGFMPNVNQVLETKAAMSIAQEFGFESVAVSVEEKVELQDDMVDESKLKPRPPVVTIMGHVDHGKTTLLDAIRESKITDSEFGGITQHIGAYTVDIHGQKIVFLDTPGHEAFTSMRARGAKVTDEVILVVAADDGIMPQTIEAIDHARAARVPIVVAINKIDVPGANPDRVMQELTKYGLTPEEWGGETICVKVSAKMKTHLDDLLEMILLQAEMLELKANPDRPAKGVIVEALLDKGRENQWQRS